MDFFSLVFNKLTSSGSATGGSSPVGKAQIVNATMMPGITYTINIGETITNGA